MMPVMDWLPFLRRPARPAPPPADLSRRAFIRGGFLRSLLPPAEAPARADYGEQADGKGEAHPPTHASAMQAHANPGQGRGGGETSGLVAHIVPRDCVAWQGTTCSTCRERCPVDGAIGLEAGRPTVVAARCTGCAACIDPCPAPRPAIRLIPKPPA